MENFIKKKNIITSKDIRGYFKKVYDSNILFKLNKISEVYITKSVKNTLRGMHYQTQPFDLNKIIICLEGIIVDVIVNIDKKDAEFGKVHHVKLEKNESIFIPSNYAHGFYCIEDATLMYLTDNVYSEESDTGVLWSSIDFNWPDQDFIISKRDKSFNKLDSL